MTRVPATTLDDIYGRHGCVGRSADANAPASASEYQSTLLEPHGECFVRDTLRQIVDRVRGVCEVEEIYVRPVGTGTFEPIEGRHFSMIGTLALVLRRRHPHEDPRVVGIMLAKDEADVIPDVVANLRPHLDRLYYIAGDEATQRALRVEGDKADTALGDRAWCTPWAVNSGGGWPGPDVIRADGDRQRLLEKARADALAEGDRRPMWVLSVQGDEIYHDDLRHHVRLAHRELATVMNCQVATFVLHESQSLCAAHQNLCDGEHDDGRYRRDAFDWSLPLERRLAHYAWDFGEHVGFLDYPWVHYVPGEHMRAHPHGLYPGRWASARPVRKHYPFRSPDQARARIADRLKSGWQPHYKNYERVFMGEQAAGRDVRRYHGWFPEAERTDGIW